MRQWGRLAAWANGHLLTMGIVFDLLIVAGFGLALQRQNDANIDRVKQAAKERSIQVTEASVQTCKSVVITITNQSRADDLATIQALQQALDGSGRAVNSALLAAEAKILERQAPTGACEPKESP